MTGYLTRRGETDGETCQLVIPNQEVRKIFIDQILEWFQEEVRRDTPRLDAFCAAFPKADAETIETQFSAYLARTISIRDTSVYHGILLGLLGHREDWYIRSNAESGNGFSDILIEIEEEGIGIVIEVKYPDSGRKAAGSKETPSRSWKTPSSDKDLEKGCREALAQIEEMGYADELEMDGMTTIIKYGIACNRKQCRVLVAD